MTAGYNDTTPEATSPAVSYIGRVKSYNFSRGFGFLECPDVHAQYGKDVFMRADAVEAVTLSKIASGSGPDAAVSRGEMFVRFTLEVNMAGTPEAQNVQQVKEMDVPEDLRRQLPEVQLKPAKVAKAKAEAGKETKESKEAKESKVKESKDSKEFKEDKDGKEKKTSKKKGKVTDALHVGDWRVHVGQDAEDNWNILSAAKGKHWFFHLTDFPSCYVILECNEPTEEEKLQCAKLCRDHTKHKLSGQVKVDATQCNNVKFDRKRDVVGECDYKDESKVEILVV